MDDHMMHTSESEYSASIVSRVTQVSDNTFMVTHDHRDHGDYHKHKEAT